MKRTLASGAAAVLFTLTPIAIAQTTGTTADPVVTDDAGDDDDFPVGLLGLLGLAGLLGLRRRDHHTSSTARH